MLLVLGTGPLLSVIIYASLGFGDPNPNPVIFGILAFLTFWPSVACMLTGLILSLVKYRSEPIPPNGS